jgi:hypothetical protein
MADNAFQTMYRKEFIKKFEQRESLLRKTVTTEAEINGNTAVFLTAGSGSATAKNRGANGLIPARADDLTQSSCTLKEWHDLVRKNNFNIFAGQGNQREIMQMTTMSVINRKIDSDIITALETGTRYAGLTGVTMALAYAMKGLAILGLADVPLDGSVTCIITISAYAYLMQTKEFTNVDYINSKPFEATGEPIAFRWAGINWIVHPNLTGEGTSTEKLLMYHRDAIGHGCDKEAVQTAVGYDDEQDYSYSRCSTYMGSKLLQNTGVVILRHDGSEFAATA